MFLDRYHNENKYVLALPCISCVTLFTSLHFSFLKMRTITYLPEKIVMRIKLVALYKAVGAVPGKSK